MQSAPQMESQYGGESNDAEKIAQVKSADHSVVSKSDAAKSPYKFDFREAGYDPRSMIKVMQILAKLSKTRTPEFFSTHPNSEHRITAIENAIKEYYPNGVPSGLLQ